MGKQSKLKQVRRTRKELEKILNLGLETGMIVEDEDGNFNFEDEMLAEQFFLRVMSVPEIFNEFVEDNPDFLRKLIEDLAEAKGVSLEIEAKKLSE